MRTPTVPDPQPLTMGRLTALVIGVPLCLAVIGWGALNAVALVSSDSFQIHRDLAPTGSQVTVSVNAGDLTLTPSPDGQVHLSGVARYGLVRPTVAITTTGAGVSISADCSWFLVDQCSVDLAVAVPSGIAVDASTDSGDITASNLGNLTLAADSGGVQVNGGSGILHLTTDSGDITALATSADTVDASADSGEVTLSFAQAASSVTVQDDSGNVVLTLPVDGPTYAVDAHSDSGNVSIGVPTDPSSAHSVSISVDSGNVSVEPGD
jgi:hypothetical protein